MEVVSAHLSQCNQLPYMEVKVVVHCKDSAKSCTVGTVRSESTVQSYARKYHEFVAVCSYECTA